MRVLTYCLPYGTAYSYSVTTSQVVDNIPNADWFYGDVTMNGHGVTEVRKNLTIFPGNWSKSKNMPGNLKGDIQNIKPDLIFYTEDPQRAEWFRRVYKTPILYWLPWDNEDVSIAQSYKVLKSCDVCVIVGKFAYQYFMNKGFNNLKQIYNPVDTSIFNKNEKAGEMFRDMNDIPKDDKILTWVGRPNWRKRLFHIITAFSRIYKKDKSVHLVVHCDIKEMGYRFEELLHGLNLLDGNAIIYPDNMSFKTGVPKEMLNALYNATDVYIAPHGGEGMGLPIVEAMAAGTPFVATDYTTTPEFANYNRNEQKDYIGTRGIGAKVSHFFDDRGVMRPYVDMDDFVNKIKYLLNKPELREDMGREGIEFVKNEIDVKVVADKWKDVFDEFKVNRIGSK